MTAEAAISIRNRARERWGRRPPSDLAEPLRMLSTLGPLTKPTSVLGTTLSDAALIVARRLREEK